MANKSGQENVSDSGQLENYLLKEYGHIAAAHFETIKAISSFFRYYLVIMALPFPIYAAIIGLSAQMSNFTYALAYLSSIISIIIALVGFCVLLYIINLRMDVVLYARTINGIRKHFYDNSSLQISTKLRMRVLPQTPSQPAYFEPSYFLPVVVAFSIFNFAYLFVGLVVLSTPLSVISEAASSNLILSLMRSVSVWVWPISLVFLVSHLVGYYLVSRHRELSYLKSHAIGIDIDGVLNEHRYHFCKLLKQNTGMTLDPEAITHIPVHEIPDLKITREHEKAVFNDIKYWSEMPGKAEAGHYIKSMRNSLKLRIYVFTHRPWPSLPEVQISSDEHLKWIQTAIKEYLDSRFVFPRMLRQMESCPVLQKAGIRMVSVFYETRMKTKWIPRLRLNPIDIISKCWLQKRGIVYDSLTVEMGSEDVADPQGHFKNRFYLSRKKKIKFFAEDDPEKASKLAYLCDIVFLMDQPYNRDEEDEAFPNNVIRVKSWDEIYRQVRKYS